ncbi:DUF4105 domain-containing protein [Acinetobacter sp. SWAC5]|jgi:hypothetical protein|nr:DUF4105 domain-containing protein [Acinetobacter sp. SWAC5]
MQQPSRTNSSIKSFMRKLAHGVFSLFVVLSSAWLCMAIWVQQPINSIVSYAIIGFWIAFALSILGIYFSHLLSRRKDILIYGLAFLFALIWYFSLPARQDRDWNPEVAKMLSYEKHGDQVTLHNVRNFDWHADGRYTERWKTRHYNLNDITGVNIITSYWMGPKIAHTLVSFDFAHSAPLTFSIEIRKEKNEDFSAIGGFFRKFEVSLIAADEKDIIYTRSNIRGEQVYFFPINMGEAERKALFEEYLSKSDDLAKHAKWYNTLTSNCTTLIFDMVQAVSKQHLPVDYRLLASGYLPNYLYDLNALSHQWDIATWYRRAHVNPRVTSHHTLSSAQYSALIRQGLSSVTHTAPQNSK